MRKFKNKKFRSSDCELRSNGMHSARFCIGVGGAAAERPGGKAQAFCGIVATLFESDVICLLSVFGLCSQFLAVRLAV